MSIRNLLSETRERERLLHVDLLEELYSRSVLYWRPLIIYKYKSSRSLPSNIFFLFSSTFDCSFPGWQHCNRPSVSAGSQTGRAGTYTCLKRESRSYAVLEHIYLHMLQVINLPTDCKTTHLLLSFNVIFSVFTWGRIMGQKMEAAFKMNPNGGGGGGGGGDSGSGGGSVLPANQSESSQNKSNGNTSTLLSTLHRHRKNKTESTPVNNNNNNKQNKAEQKREKRSSSSSSFKMFFNKFGSRGMLLYNTRQEVDSSDIMSSCDPKQPLVIKSEKDPSRSTGKRHNPSIYHRHSLSSHSRPEFFSYIKCDDPTDGLSLERRSPEKIDKEQPPLPIAEETPHQKEAKKGSSLKRSHFPYSFLRSKLGTLTEDVDRHQLIPNEINNNNISTSSSSNTAGAAVDVSRQNSITSLDLRPAQAAHRSLSTVRGFSRHLSSNESGYDSDSARNVDSGEKWSPSASSYDDQRQDVTRARQLVIGKLSETEDVGIVTRLKLLPNNGQVPVVTGMLENGAAFR